LRLPCRSGAQLLFSSTFVLLMHVAGVVKLSPPRRRTLQARPRAQRHT
jgi:hypothetical protein